MAQIKVEDVVDHLGREFRKPLAQTIHEAFSDVRFDDRELFKTLKRQVYRACSVWGDVPDDLVRR